MNLRLPTRKEFQQLKQNHFTKWDAERKGLVVLNDQQQELFLPALGFYDPLACNDSDKRYSNYGVYWTSDDWLGATSNSVMKYVFMFSPDGKYNIVPHPIAYWCSVRLVSDEPFPSAIEFDGLYWSQKNDGDYESVLRWCNSEQIELGDTQSTIFGYLARDRYGSLSIWKECPVRMASMGIWTFPEFKCREKWITDTMDLDNKLFPELRWEDEPINVKITIEAV